MEQEVEEDAVKEERHYSKVQAVQENAAEDDAFREEQSFDREHAPGPPLSADGDPEVPSEAAGSPQEEVCHVLQIPCSVCMHQPSDDHTTVMGLLITFTFAISMSIM